jgi:hypothetical protein
LSAPLIPDSTAKTSVANPVPGREDASEDKTPLSVWAKQKTALTTISAAKLAAAITQRLLAPFSQSRN